VTGDKAIRWSTIGAVSVVALVAAFVSYRHALAVVSEHGESGWLARAYPLTIDGLIYAASMVLLNAARRGLEAPWLAYAALGIGIAATLAANVAAGLAYGLVGAIVAAWPAPALVISYELLMFVIRSGASTPVPAPHPETAPVFNGQAHPSAPGGRTRDRTRSAPATAERAESEFTTELATGALPSLRQIRSRLHVGQDRASQVQAHLRSLTRTP
jgi:hypothetical protein